MPYMSGNSRIAMRFLLLIVSLLQGTLPICAQHFNYKNSVYAVLSDSTVALVSYRYDGDIDWKNDCLFIDSIAVFKKRQYRVVSIGEKAFQSDDPCLRSYLNHVKQVFLPETVRKIDSDVFYNRFNSLQRISLPGAMEMIGDNSFASLPSLSEVGIKGVKGIGDWAFSINPSLSQVYLDSCVCSIGKNSFFKCTRLNSINLERVLRIDEHAFESTSLGYLKIPVCTVIEDFAFADCRRIDGVTFSDDLQLVADYAFLNNTALKTLDIHSGKIGEGAFMGCTSLQSAFFSDSIMGIGQAAFWGCASLKEVCLPSNLQRIEPMTFMDCKRLESVVIPESVTFIGEAAFSGSGLTEITIPASVLEVQHDAFLNCENLKRVILYGTVDLSGILPEQVELIKEPM